MAQDYFTKVPVVSASAAIIVPVGFQAGKIEITNLNAAASPSNGLIYRAYWDFGMPDASVRKTTFTTVSATLCDVTTYSSTNGISMKGFGSFAAAQYGAVVSGFTNASNGVITVDNTTGIAAGAVILVAAIADDQSTAIDLNGQYTVQSVTSTTITLTTSTSGASVYISGGFVTLVTNANATTPNPPNDIYSNVPTWYNQAYQGFTIGTAIISTASAADVLSVSVWDRNSGGL